MGVYLDCLSSFLQGLDRNSAMDTGKIPPHLQNSSISYLEESLHEFVSKKGEQKTKSRMIVTPRCLLDMTSSQTSKILFSQQNMCEEMLALVKFWEEWRPLPWVANCKCMRARKTTGCSQCQYPHRWWILRSIADALYLLATLLYSRLQGVCCCRTTFGNYFRNLRYPKQRPPGQLKGRNRLCDLEKESSQNRLKVHRKISTIVGKAQCIVNGPLTSTVNGALVGTKSGRENRLQYDQMTRNKVRLRRSLQEANFSLP